MAAPAAGGHLRCLHRSKPRRGESAVAAKAAGGHRWPKGRTPQDPLPRWQATPATIHQQKPHAGFSVLTKPMHRQAEITPLKNCTYKQTTINSNQPHVGSHAHCTPPCHTLVSGEQLRSRSNDSVTCKQSSYSTCASIAACAGSMPLARMSWWLPEFCKCCKMFCLQSSWR